MRNTGILLLLVGAFFVINAGSFRDVVLGKAKLNFVNPKTAATSSSTTSTSSTNKGSNARGTASAQGGA